MAGIPMSYAQPKRALSALFGGRGRDPELGEGARVRWVREAGRVIRGRDTSPSRRYATGPSLSPLRAERGFSLSATPLERSAR
jgi:hypothetical protein